MPKTPREIITLVILDRIDDVDKLDKIGRRAFGLNEGQPIGVQLNVLNISGSMIESA